MIPDLLHRGARSEREQLARDLRAVVSGAEPSKLPGASPLNRAVVRPNAELLLAIADRLDEAGRPVSVAALTGVRTLVSGRGGLLYDDRTDPRELHAELASLLADLEGH